MKRLVSSILAALILSSIIGCAAQSEPPGNDTAASGDTNASTTPVEETTKTAASIVTEKYADKDYGGAEIHILSFQPGAHFYSFTSATENELWYEEQTGNALNDAIYDRNRMTEELLNVKIVPEFVSDPTATYKNSVTSSDGAFEAAINRLDYQANIAAEGYSLNLRAIPSIDVTNPWWDEGVVNTFTLFKDKLYFISGDINYYDDYAVQCIYFNERIYSEEGFEYNLYNLVREGKWTFDLLKQMSLASTRDLDGDGKITILKDQYGYADNTSALLHHIYLFGQKLSEIDQNGVLQVSAMSDKMYDVVDKLYAFFNESKAVYVNGYDGSTAFNQSKVLFFTDMIGVISNFRDLEDDFGILPMPRPEEGEPKYSAYVSNGWSTAYSIPKTNQQAERTGVVLEAMSAFSVNTVTTTLYDVMLESKLIRNNDSRDMLSYIFDSKVYDWAGDLAWGSNMVNVFNSLATSNSNTFASSMEKVMKPTNKQLEKLIEAYSGVTE
jgi:ABC-type glycerol-3-phosphate transport system substrate-binding protein